MKYSDKNYLLEILRELSKSKIKFIVCGGVAVVLHGVERMTIDLDLAIDFSSDNVKKFNKLIKRFGFIPRAPISANVLEDEKKREQLIKEKNAFVFTYINPKKPYMILDIFLKKDTYNSLLKNTVIKKISNNFIRIASIEQIIAMKKKIKPLRDKDIYDIKALTKIKELK
jgi:hypothetical protein